MYIIYTCYNLSIYLSIYMCILKFITLLRHVSSGPMMGEVSLETVPLNILAHDVINLLHIYIYIYIYINIC